MFLNANRELRRIEEQHQQAVERLRSLNLEPRVGTGGKFTPPPIDTGALFGKDGAGNTEEATAALDDMDRALDLVIRQFEELDDQYARQIAGLERVGDTGVKVAEEVRDAWDDVLDIYEQEERENQRRWAEQEAGISRTIDASKQLGSAWQSLGGTFSSAFEDAIVNGEKLRDVLRGLGQDIFRILTRKLVTERLAGSIVGGLEKIFPFASGGDFYAHQPMLVGEEGPELVSFPRGGHVTPNGALGGSTTNYYIDARGADAGVEQRIKRAIRESENRAVHRSVSAVAENKLRGGSYAKTFSS